MTRDTWSTRCMILGLVFSWSVGLAAVPQADGVTISSVFFVPGNTFILGKGFYFLPERREVGGISREKITGGIWVWRTDDGRVDHFIPFPKMTWPDEVDISQDGARIAIIFFDSGQMDRKPDWLGCYSLVGKHWLWRWKWEKYETRESPRQVKFCSDSRKMLIVGYWSMWYLDADTGEEIGQRRGFLKEYPVLRWGLRSSYISPSGRYLVIWQEKPFEGIGWGLNKFVTVWDLALGKEVVRWRKPTCECEIAAFSPDEESIVFGCKDGYVREWSIKTRSLVREFSTRGNISSVVFSTDGRYLGVNSDCKEIIIFDRVTQKMVHTFVSSGREYTQIVGEQYPMAFSSDGQLFTFRNEERKICLYSTSTWEQKWCVDPKPPHVPNE